MKAGLQLLHEYGISVRALVLDGSISNQRTVKMLGASLDVDDFRPSFLHPSNSEPVHVIFDPCHMVKLIRNLFCDYGVLLNRCGKRIKWQHIVSLNDLQMKKGSTLPISYVRLILNIRIKK